MNLINLSVSKPNLHLVVNNASVKCHTLKSFAIHAPASTKSGLKNTSHLPAVLLTVLLHLLIAFMLYQKNPVQTPAKLSLPMMVTFLHENKVQTPTEATPVEIKPIPLKPTPKTPQKIVANTQEKAVVLATEQTAELTPIADLTSTPSAPQPEVALTETTRPTAVASNEAPPVKANPVYIAPSFGADYLHNPSPEYPNMARRKGEQGRVLLKVLVTQNGDAGNVTLEKSSGSTYLDEAAVNAVKHWKFIPARSNNEAVSGYVTVPISFSLES